MSPPFPLVEPPFAPRVEVLEVRWRRGPLREKPAGRLDGSLTGARGGLFVLLFALPAPSEPPWSPVSPREKLRHREASEVTGRTAGSQRVWASQPDPAEESCCPFGSGSD